MTVLWSFKRNPNKHVKVKEEEKMCITETEVPKRIEAS